MRIVCALDVHRSQITYLTVDVGSGEISRGRISPATRPSVRAWLARFDGVDDVQFALEGTTGWRFVVEEIERAGHRARLADPAETAARRGRKRRAKTDGADCDLLLKLLATGELPESWIPVLCRACWSRLHPWIVSRVGVHGRAAVVDGSGAQSVVAGFVALDLA